MSSQILAPYFVRNSRALREAKSKSSGGDSPKPYNLSAPVCLLQVERKRPSLSFYAKRKVYFLGPHYEQEWQEHLAASGKKMIILQTPLRREIPEAVSDWIVVLEHGGFSLLSSEPLL